MAFQRWQQPLHGAEITTLHHSQIHLLLRFARDDPGNLPQAALDNLRHFA